MLTWRHLHQSSRAVPVSSKSHGFNPTRKTFSFAWPWWRSDTPEHKDFDRDVLASCSALCLNIPFPITPRLWLSSDERRPHNTFVLQNWIQSSSALKGSKFPSHSIHSDQTFRSNVVFLLGEMLRFIEAMEHIMCHAVLWPLWPDPLFHPSFCNWWIWVCNWGGILATTTLLFECLVAPAAFLLPPWWRLQTVGFGMVLLHLGIGALQSGAIGAFFLPNVAA